jgi:hypothetical protein
MKEIFLVHLFSDLLVKSQHLAQLKVRGGSHSHKFALLLHPRLFPHADPFCLQSIAVKGSGRLWTGDLSSANPPPATLASRGEL